MNAKLINPFVLAAYNCIETMTGITPEREKPYIKEDALSRSDLTGTVGFVAKGVLGSLSLGFQAETIIKIYNIIVNENETRITREIQDLAGELTNIITGGAKKEFSKFGLSFEISIPLVARGKNITIHHQVNTPVIVLPFTIEESPFLLEVAMKIKSKSSPLV